MKAKRKNGYKISELTLGTVQLGIPYGINNERGMPSEAEAKEILDTAISLGITSFDTAKNYGRSEAVLGRYFRENPTEKTVITKFELSGERESELRDAIFRKTEDSLRVLGLSKIPMLMLHSESYIDEYGTPLIRALGELKSAGLVDCLGISFSDKSRISEHLSSGFLTACKFL